MSNELDPVLNNWYFHLDKGQRFEVVAIDEANGVIDIQYFDGDLDEIELSLWSDMDIELAEEPENFSGPFDVGELDDFGTGISDTTEEDWQEPYGEIRQES